MLQTIFQIDKALEELFLSLPEDGTMTDEQVEQYESLSLAKATKHQNTLEYYRRLELDEEMIDSELNRLKALKTSLNAKKESIMHLIGFCMDKMDVSELNFGSIKAVKKLNPPKVVLDETVQLPGEYTRQKIVIEPDKSKIKEALKAGQTIEGAHLEQDTRITIS